MTKFDSDTGKRLVADYQSIFINIATSEAAKRAAEESEQAILEQLGQVTEGDFFQPGDLDVVRQAVLTRESIDAHIKKAQAAQLGKLSSSQLSKMIQSDAKEYKNRKVRITSTNNTSKPFKAMWFDKSKGYRTSPYTVKTITGSIKEVLLDRNAIVIRPSWTKRMFLPNLHFYAVYVINPETLQPMVEIVVLS